MAGPPRRFDTCTWVRRPAGRLVVSGREVITVSMLIIAVLAGVLGGMILGVVAYTLLNGRTEDPSGGGLWSVDPMHPDAYVTSDDAYRPDAGWFELK